MKEKLIRRRPPADI